MTRPTLTVAIPTRDRPALLRRALASVTTDAPRDVAERVEIVVSDNAADPDDERATEVAQPLLDAWPGPTRIVRHRPSVGMVDNFNACVDAASGEHVLLLHDDDYLLPGGLTRVVRTLDGTDATGATLYGVRLVNLDEQGWRQQRTRRRTVLPPPDALRRVLTHSSFVRFPAIVVARSAYEAVGPFDPSVGGATDFDMWVRLFARFGVRRVPETVCAYTIHAGAATASVFNEATLDNVERIFERARATGVLPEHDVRRCHRSFVHRFILAGTVRSLRAGNRGAAADAYRLFQLPHVRALGVDPRWLPLRLTLGLAVIGAR